MGTVSGRTINVSSAFFLRLDDDALILRQAVFLRLSTRRGTYWNRPDYGTLLSDYIKRGIDANTLAHIPGEIAAEVEQDRRIARATVKARVEPTARRGGYKLILTITITPVIGDDFTVAIGVDKLTGMHFVRDGG